MGNPYRPSLKLDRSMSKKKTRRARLQVQEITEYYLIITWVLPYLPHDPLTYRTPAQIPAKEPHSCSLQTFYIKKTYFDPYLENTRKTIFAFSCPNLSPSPPSPNTPNDTHSPTLYGWLLKVWSLFGYPEY